MPKAHDATGNKGIGRNNRRALTSTEVPLNRLGRPLRGTRSRQRYDDMLSDQVIAETKRVLKLYPKRVTLSIYCRDGNHPACDPSWQECGCTDCHKE